MFLERSDEREEREKSGNRSHFPKQNSHRARPCSLHCAYATCYNMHTTNSNDRLNCIQRKGLRRYAIFNCAFMVDSAHITRVFDYKFRVKFPFSCLHSV